METETESKRSADLIHIIRPFGLIGGDFEVDEAGLQKYRAAYALAIVTAGLFVIGRHLSAPAWLVFGGAGVGAAAILALSVDVARKGRKLE